MPWSTLPPEVLAKIFSYLRFRDRVELALVCRRWNDVIFGLCPADDYLLPLRSFDFSEDWPSLLAGSSRRYRNLEIEWEEPQYFDDVTEEEFFNCLDEVLALIGERGPVRCLWLTMPLDARMVRFLREHEEFFDLLEELWLMISCRTGKSRRDRTKWTPIELRFSNLKVLKWVECDDYEGESFDQFVFGLGLPSVTKIKFSRENDLLSRDRSLIVFRNVNNVKDLSICNLDEYCAKQYFKEARPSLKRLCLDNTMREMPLQDLMNIARNLENVLFLKFNMLWNDFSPALTLAAMLPSLTELSLTLYKIELSSFCRKLQDLHDLKVLHLTCEDECKVNRDSQLKLPNLLEFRCNIETPNDSDHRVVLNSPKITIFQQINHSSEHHANYFQLSQFDLQSQLTTVDLLWTRDCSNFFTQQSLPNLRTLRCHIPTIQPGYVSEFATLTIANLQDLTLRFNKLPNPYIDQLLQLVFANACQLRRFELSRFALSYQVFSKITQLGQLSELVLIYGEIIGPVEQHLRMEKLVRLDVHDVSVVADQLDSFLIWSPLRKLDRVASNGNSLYGRTRTLLPL